MLRKLILLSLLLTTVPAAFGMEGKLTKKEVLETNLPAESITLISSGGDAFKVVPDIAEFSDMIKGFFEMGSSASELMLETKTKQYALNDFASETVELLTKLVNQIQQAIENQENDKKLTLDGLIKAPNGHIIAKNLQKVVNEQLESENPKDLGQLLRLTDFLCMPALSNVVASVYLREFQKEQKICDISDLKIWLATFGFGEQVSDLLVKHWYLQQAGITQEWSIKDLIATTENKPVVDSDGELDLEGKQLTSLDGLYDIQHMEQVMYLYLNDNQLSVLEVGIFKALRALEHLHLGHNQLSVLKVGVFSELSALKGLYLSDNQLGVLEVGVFDGLSAFGFLYLSNNKLGAIEVDVFNELRALKFLCLRNNQLTEQNKQEIKDKIKQTAPNCRIDWRSCVT